MEGSKGSSCLQRCAGGGGQEAAAFVEENMQETLNEFSRHLAQRKSLLDSSVFAHPYAQA